MFLLLHPLLLLRSPLQVHILGTDYHRGGIYRSTICRNHYMAILRNRDLPRCRNLNNDHSTRTNHLHSYNPSTFVRRNRNIQLLYNRYIRGHYTQNIGEYISYKILDDEQAKKQRQIIGDSVAIFYYFDVIEHYYK